MPSAQTRLAFLPLLACSILIPPRPARAATFDALQYLNGTTVKVEQVIGDHDWADTTRAVRSQTLTRADVLGNDIGTSFVSGDSLIFLFGDTIGATSQYVPTWADPLNPYKWNARDPLAGCSTSQPDSALLLDFFFNDAGDSTLIVAPVYPDGSTLQMGIDDVPNAGIDLDGRIYLVCKVGTTMVGGVAVSDSDSSVVVRFHPILKTFTARRTISRAAGGGHFLTTALRELPMQFAGSPTDSEVLVFGLGRYRHSDVYLSMIPKADFEAGVDSQGQSATRYFTGLVSGQPTWSAAESLAVPVVQDDPLREIGVGELQSPWPNDDPTVGNLSVAWCPTLGLWMMTFDGGRQPTAFRKTQGVYFSYATAPWGPWVTPQLIFNAIRDGASGTFMRHYDHATGVGTGPAGPTIGDQSSNDPDTTSGGIYSPGLIEPFVRVAGDTLKIDYTVSTWNPYTIVRMRSEFLVIPGQTAVQAGPSSGPGRLGAIPNPFRSGTRLGFSIGRPGRVDVDVYDLAGRHVRALHPGMLAAGDHALWWDGATDAGARASAGVYFVRVRGPGAVLEARVARIE